MNLTCPKCGRFLSEIGASPGQFGRSVCRDCGVEVSVTVKAKGA